MKSSFLGLVSSLALVAWSEPLPRLSSTKVTRDVATVSSAIFEVQGAVERLDATVRAFEGDEATLQADADNLISTIKTCTGQIEDSGDIDLGDAVSLTGPIMSLSSCSQNLISDMIAKREIFETAMICGVVESTMEAIDSATASLTEAVTDMLPEFAQNAAQSVIDTLLDALTDGVTQFNEENCQDDVPATAPLLPTEGITTFPTMPVPTELLTTAEAVTHTGGTTVTVTDTDCESSELATAPPPTFTQETSASVVLSTSTPLITTSLAVPSNSTPTATQTQTPTLVPTVPATTPIQTAGAVLNAARPLSVIAGLAAVLLL